MKKALLKLFVVVGLGLFIVACTSPEEKKAEEISGFKVNELKKAVDIKRKLEKLVKLASETKDSSKLSEIKKQGKELEKEARKYGSQIYGVNKILETDPEVYKKIFGEDRAYKQAIEFHKFIK